MKYEVITDKDGYVLIIRHTATPRDFVELDLSEYDFNQNRLHSYKLGKDCLIFDQDHYNAINQAQTKFDDLHRIEILKKKLADSDYIMARCLEEILALNNPLTFIADYIRILAKYSNEYRTVLRNRIIWRNTIRELEDKYGR